MHIPTKHDIRTLTMVIERLLPAAVGRPVEVNFSHLGEVEYTVAIQTSLWEFDPETESGPLGPMHLTLNVNLLTDNEELVDVLGRIMKAGE